MNLMESRPILELVSYQSIIVTMDVLDQYSIIDCDLVFEKCSFHWNGLVVSYSLFCINIMEFLGFGFI